MGDIVFWAIIRCAIIIPVIYLVRPFMDYSTWWCFGILSLYAVIVHPVVIHYHLFLDRNKDIFDSTLCSSCRHFDKTAVLCCINDEHPTVEYLPCEGMSWEPRTVTLPEEKEPAE